MRTRKLLVLSLVSAGAFLFSACPSNPPTECLLNYALEGAYTGLPGYGYLVHYYVDLDAGTPAACQLPVYTSQFPIGIDFVGTLNADNYGIVKAQDRPTGVMPEEFGWTGAYTGNFVQGTPNLDGGNFPNPVSFGHFTTTNLDPTTGLCRVVEVDAGTQVINAGAANAVTVTYSYPTIDVYDYVYAGGGTQIRAAVTITRDDGTGNPCVQHYTGLGMWPVILCNVDNDCNPFAQPPTRIAGSGLLPGIPYQCNTTMPNMDFISVAGITSPTCGQLADGGQPFILQTPGCGGPAFNNNLIQQPVAGVCFYPNASPATFPYVTAGTQLP